ncbi:hypothetical protein ACJVDH_00295 [Pedobacter sp. AW1-32]|uniref:hypothetical protein n=1 Tax=Pedobacter sp. AW1-32 TaxID=3383026 RepID=UPI003FEEB22E
MEKKFEVGYSYKTFGGIIGAGVFTVDADTIEDVKKVALDLSIKSIKDDHDDEADYKWNDEFQNISCSVSEAE